MPDSQPVDYIAFLRFQADSAISTGDAEAFSSLADQLTALRKNTQGCGRTYTHLHGPLLYKILCSAGQLCPTCLDHRDRSITTLTYTTPRDAHE